MCETIHPSVSQSFPFLYFTSLHFTLLCFAFLTFSQDGITLSESALRLEIEDAKRDAFQCQERLREATLHHDTTIEQLDLRVERAESHSAVLQRKVTYLEDELKRNVGVLLEKERALEVC